VDIIEKTKKHLLATVEKYGHDYDYLLRHLSEAEKWAQKILDEKPEADRKIVMLSVWLHDIGQMIGDRKTDHAINSEIEAKRFLKEEGVDYIIIEKVAHCVRSHRCKDVQPETLEAKILAAADSSSHMTDIIYIDMAYEGRVEEAKQKLERDFRDKGLFPEFQEKSKPLYEAWKKLLEVYPQD